MKENRINLYAIDIDGVVADISHRLHYMQEKNYEKFYDEEELAEDKPIRAGIDLVNRLFLSEDSLVVFITGRPYSTNKATREWLDRHSVNYSRLIFYREDGDYRPSPEVKAERMKQIVDEVNDMFGKAKDAKKFGRAKDIEELVMGNIYFIDDDPENVEAIEEAYPNVAGIIFSTKRIRELENKG